MRASGWLILVNHRFAWFAFSDRPSFSLRTRTIGAQLALAKCRKDMFPISSCWSLSCHTRLSQIYRFHADPWGGSATQQAPTRAPKSIGFYQLEWCGFAHVNREAIFLPSPLRRCGKVVHSKGQLHAASRGAPPRSQDRWPARHCQYADACVSCFCIDGLFRQSWVESLCSIGRRRRPGQLHPLAGIFFP